MVKILRISKKWLGEILVDEGLLTPEQVNEALEAQKKTGELLGQILVRFEWVTERDIAKTVAKQLSLPYISASSYFISDDFLKLVPFETLLRLQVVPVDRFGQILVILAAGAVNNGQLEELEQITGLTLRVFVGTSADVKTILDRIAEAQGKSQEEEKPKKPRFEEALQKPAKKAKPAKAVKAAADSPPVEEIQVGLTENGVVDSDAELGYAPAPDGVPAPEVALPQEDLSAVSSFFDQCDKNVKEAFEKSTFEFTPEHDKEEDKDT